MSRELFWVRSSKDDLRSMPEEVVREFGFVLRAVQEGEHHESIKKWKGEAGVYEIRVSDSDSTFRTVYVVNLASGIYVLHAFQKKSPNGVKTAQKDVDMVVSRLQEAKEQDREIASAANFSSSPKKNKKLSK